MSTPENGKTLFNVVETVDNLRKEVDHLASALGILVAEHSDDMGLISCAERMTESISASAQAMAEEITLFAKTQTSTLTDEDAQ